MSSYRNKNRVWIQPLWLAIFVFCLVVISGLVLALVIVNKRLNSIAQSVEAISNQHITANVPLNKSIAVNSRFRISEAVTVGIDMMVEAVIPIDVEIPINEKMLVPIKVGVKDYIKIDTTIVIKDYVYANVEDTIAINQKVTIPTSKRKGIQVPINANIPLNERVKVSVNQAVAVRCVVPVEMLIIDTLDVGVKMKVPVKLKIPVRIPVNTLAKVSFPESIAVVGEIPVSLTIPVDIPLSETTLSPYFKQVSNGLNGLINLNTDVP